MLDHIASELRYAARALLRSPGFSGAAIATVALGIGVNAGMFTTLNGLLFRDVPAPDAHELVSIRQSVEGGDFPSASMAAFSTAEFAAYQSGAETLSGILAHSNPAQATLGGQTPRQLFGLNVSCNYFDVLEQLPAVGRALTAEDCVPSAPPVVVLGHALWTTTFGADPGIVGGTVELNRQLFTVVGVAAEGTYGASPMLSGFFAPLSAEPLLAPRTNRFSNDRAFWLQLIGRRRDGASLEQVRAELAVIAAQIDRLHPGRSTTLTVERAKPVSVPPHLRGPATAAGAVLMAAFGFVLLIACANVANLLLARGTARSQELGVRLSLGASRARVLRQLLAESLLISLVGGLLGCLLAFQLFPVIFAYALPALAPPEFPAFVLDIDLSPDVGVLTFAMALTLGTGLLFGLVPSLQVSKPDLHAVMKQGAAARIGGRGGRLRGALVGVQIGLSMALMIAAGLLIRGLHATYSIDPGFAYRNVAYLSYGLDGPPFEADEAAAFRQRLRDRVAALPGVEAVAYVADPPLGEERAAIPIRLPGEAPDTFRLAELNSATPDYFDVVGIPILSGRKFTDAEVANAGPDTATTPAIVTESTARNLWPGDDPLGRVLLWGDNRLQVVGVAADARVSSVNGIDPYYVYLPGGDDLIVRSELEFAALASSIYSIVQSLDPSLVVRVLPLEAGLGWWRGVSAAVTALGASLGVLALVLATVGIYGVVAYAVTRRYREIGIRMALGADAGGVLGMVLRQTLRPVAIGAAIGVAAAVSMSGILRSVLFGVSSADPVGIGGAALFVLAVALAAGTIAARPATKADPTTVLRYE